MLNFNIPLPINFILEKIEEQGYEAYLVGGCVRDFVLGREVADYDITTNAHPKEVLKIFDGSAYVVGTGLKHGTVTVIKENFSAEITTFRVDGYYKDNRHPENVQFSSSLEDDVLRRDFTVNALAYSPKRGLKDFTGGLDDIKKRIIRCVGEPAVRFKEDSLRILRGIRFSSVLGFDIDKLTADTILNKAYLLGNISKERISVEFLKLLCGENAEEVLLKYRDVIAVFIPQIKNSFDFEQFTPYHKYDVYTHSVKAVCATDNNDKVLRISAFLHDVGKPDCFFTDTNGIGHFYGHAQKSTEIAKEILTDLRFDNGFKENVLQLIKHHDAPIENDEKRIKRLLKNLGEKQFFRLLSLQRADNAAQSEIVFYRRARFDAVEETAKRILSEKSCFSLSDLAINGKDLLSLGLPQGKIIGNILNQLLDDVIENKTVNKKEALLKLAEKYGGIDDGNLW